MFNIERNTISYHPNWGGREKYYIPIGTNKVIIGSMPPRRLCTDFNGNKLEEYNNADIDFFYGSKDNCFWKILGFINENRKKSNLDEIFKVNKNYSVDDCRMILKENNIGILDIITSCVHNDKLATDNNLYNIKPIELIEILKKNKEIDTIFCTSNYVKDLLCIYYVNNIKYNKKEKCGEILFEGIDKVYKLYVLYSPTRRVFNMYKAKSDIYLKNYYLLFY